LQLSEGHPICAICGRGDLDTSFPEARGCYDTKVTSWRLALEMSAEAVNGPTTGGEGLSTRQHKSHNGKIGVYSVNDNGGNSTVVNRISGFIKNLVNRSKNILLLRSNNRSKLPEFTWTGAQKAVGEDLLHRGQPERFNFKFERQSPELMMESGCKDGSLREVEAAVLARV